MTRFIQLINKVAGLAGAAQQAVTSHLEHCQDVGIKHRGKHSLGDEARQSFLRHPLRNIEIIELLKILIPNHSI